MAAAWPAIIVFILCVVFSYMVGRQYFNNHRLNNLFWFVSLILAALASLFYAVSALSNPHSAAAFALYYVFGAMWMPAVMGLGSIGLLASRKVTWIFAAAVFILGAVGTVFLAAASINAGQLANLDGGAGTGIITTGIWLPFLIVLNSFGAAAVIIVALLSAWKTGRRQTSTRFLYGNIWIAVGVIVISAAGSAARLGLPQMFWITMLIGWIITFVGYRMLSPASVFTPVSVTASKAHG